MKKTQSAKLSQPKKKKITLHIIKSFFWFLIGIVLGIFFLASFAFIIFQNFYKNTVYPGVMINGISFEGKTEKEVKEFFAKKNAKIAGTKFIFKINDLTTISLAKQLNFGYDENLLAKQAYSVGRSKNTLSNISLVLQAYINGVNLQPSYHYSESELISTILPIRQKMDISPTDALFAFENNKVVAFRPSSDGQEIDIVSLKNQILLKMPLIIQSEKPQTIDVSLSLKVVKPKVTTDKANDLGIKELISEGTSLFQHSIPGRIFNVILASTRLNGILVVPNEVFSFNEALGDVSSFTGYQQAYIIQNGRTVLGDGGGVCQVSTTLFRAILNAGLPIIERHAHAYRVGYYEQDAPPGFDATVYGPSVDLKFKNDTQNYILIQTFVDPNVLRLTFKLYGTKDNREISISKPVIASQAPPPETLYQDDPTLPKGEVKQVDFPAWGANVSFTREVKKDGKVIISEKFISNFKPWQAIYLRGTKE